MLVFETRSGDLFVTQQEKGYAMDFPLSPPTKEVQCVETCRLNYWSKDVCLCQKVNDALCGSAGIKGIKI